MKSLEDLIEEFLNRGYNDAKLFLAWLSLNGYRIIQEPVST